MLAQLAELEAHVAATAEDVLDVDGIQSTQLRFCCMLDDSVLQHSLRGYAGTY